MMTRQASSRAIPRGRVQPRRAGLSARRTEMSHPVATRPLWMQRVSGTYNFFYFHDMRPRRRRRVARRSVATEPRSGRKRPRNKNVSDIVSFQQARGFPAHYEYAPFGAVTAVATNTAFTAFNVAETNPFRFSSEYSDDTLGLVYYNYRHYNPMDGRRLQRDPYNSLGNSYSFCKNLFEGNFDCLGLNGLEISPKSMERWDASDRHIVW